MSRGISKAARVHYLISMSVLLVVVHTYVLSDNATYIDLRIKTLQTKEIASEILGRIYEVDGYTTATPVMIVGTINNNNFPMTNSRINDMSIGHVSEWGSFWEDNQGSRNCWNAIYRDYFGIDINLCSDEMYSMIIESEEYLRMGNFPSKDSVVLIDGVVVVKLDAV